MRQLVAHRVRRRHGQIAIGTQQGLLITNIGNQQHPPLIRVGVGAAKLTQPATYAFFCKFPVSSTEKSDIGLLFGKPLFIQFNEHCGGDSQERPLVWEDPNVASPFFQLLVLEFDHVGSAQPFSGEVIFSHTVDSEAFGDV